jgi:hypothetical protein
MTAACICRGSVGIPHSAPGFKPRFDLRHFPMRERALRRGSADQRVTVCRKVKTERRRAHGGAAALGVGDTRLPPVGAGRQSVAAGHARATGSAIVLGRNGPRDELSGERRHQAMWLTTSRISVALRPSTASLARPGPPRPCHGRLPRGRPTPRQRRGLQGRGGLAAALLDVGAIHLTMMIIIGRVERRLRLSEPPLA